MPRAPKHCGRCGDLVVGRCWRCAPRSPTSRAADDPAERARRSAAVAAHVAQHGWVCPGFQRPPHPSRDLTAAHTRAVVLGGKHSDLVVRCRSCNSREGVNGG